MVAIKQKIIQACREELIQKIMALKSMVAEVNEAGNSETKSSAGDKHETARAMMQLEQEKLGNQLRDAELNLAEFERTDFNKNFQTVGQGSLVQTDKGYFFIAGPLGKIAVESETVFAVSSKSPLASILIGHKQNDTVLFNGVAYYVISVS